MRRGLKACSFSTRHAANLACFTGLPDEEGTERDTGKARMNCGATGFTGFPDEEGTEIHISDFHQ